MRSSILRFAAVLLPAYSSLGVAADPAPGVTDREILISQVAVLTGPAAELGLWLRAGTQAHFISVNMHRVG